MTYKKPLKIAVIALLKPSQVKYKISPLLHSDNVEQLILFRKNKFKSSDTKLMQYVLPKYMRQKLFYWTLTPFFIAYKLRKHNVDMLLTYRFIPHTYYTWVVSKLLRKPFIYSQIDQDVVTLCNNTYGKRFVKFIMKDALQINVPGSVSLAFWQKMYPRTPINIIHSTIDTDVFKPVDQELLYDMVYVGVLTKLKQVDLMIKAIHFLISEGQNVRFAVVGYGPEKKSLEDYVVEHGLQKHIIFLGKRDVDAKLLCSAKIFSMASKSEGLPCALMEAMACERLCISTNVGNISDAIIEGNTGYFYHSLIPDEMGKQISELLNKFDKLYNVRKQARAHIIENHSFVSATKKWDNVLCKF